MQFNKRFWIIEAVILEVASTVTVFGVSFCLRLSWCSFYPNRRVEPCLLFVFSTPGHPIKGAFLSIRS